MKSLPIALFRAAQVRELDRLAIEEAGIPGATLMARAGVAAYAQLKNLWPGVHQIVVLCGTGNNGGDGYVIARLALEDGLQVSVCQAGDPGRLRGDGQTAATAYQQSGGKVLLLEQTGDRALGTLLGDADVLVDALLGTGLSGTVADGISGVIEAINHSRRPVLAVDIPSGLHADTGQALGVAVRAHVTVSFIALKQGLFTGSGPDYCGAVIYEGLQVPGNIITGQRPAASRLTLDALRHRLAPRPRSAHKGRHGHVLIVGGDQGMHGAALLAGEAAARSGAGLVSIATREAAAATLSAACPELMAQGVEDRASLRRLLERVNVVAVGPGLGRSPWAQQLLETLLDTDLPLVVDADALGLLAREPHRREHWILTPHPGEAGRLLGSTAQEVQADRFAAAKGIRERFGGVCVLKGAGTLVDDGAVPVGVCCAGNPGMAAGGMGDVLTGVIAGLLAQQRDEDPFMRLRIAARLGVCVHAGAGDRAAAEGERGMMARDLMPWIRVLVNP